MVTCLGATLKFVNENASISPALKFWFCNTELDTHVFVVRARSVERIRLPFLVAFTVTPDPESVNPIRRLAVQGTLQTHDG